MIVAEYPLHYAQRFWCVRCGGYASAKDSGCLCQPPDVPLIFPLGVAIHGNVNIGEGTEICEPADINGTKSSIVIGPHCDIAGFVTINCADSSKRCLGLSASIERLQITIGDHVFIGTGAVILGGCEIGDHSVIGAGVVLKRANVPPYSRVTAAQPVIWPGFYVSALERQLR